MSWYYADNNERRGPIEDAAFQTLVASGTIKPDTLVWREGMAEWTPYSRLQAPAASAAGASTAPSPTGAVATGATTCSQCGRIFSADELIFLAGRPVCAQCKPLVVQQMMEGTDVSGAPFDSAAFLADLRARGGYRLDIGHIISRAWSIFTGNFWPCVGVTILLYLTLMLASVIPCLGNLAPFLVNGPIFGGLYLYFIKQVRGQRAEVGDGFAGFTSPHFGRLALAGTVQTLIIGVIGMILVAPGMIMNWSILQSNNPSEVPWAFIICLLVAMIPVIYLSICWFFSYALIIDRRMEFWPAMELSRKVVGMKFFSWILLMIVNALITMAGAMAVCVGLLVAMPLTFCGLMVAYEDIFSPTSNRAP